MIFFILGFSFFLASMTAYYSTPCTVISPMVSFWASSWSKVNLFLGLIFSFLQMLSLFSPSGKSPLKKGNLLCAELKHKKEPMKLTTAFAKMKQYKELVKQGVMR